MWAAAAIILMLGLIFSSLCRLESDRRPRSDVEFLFFPSLHEAASVSIFGEKPQKLEPAKLPESSAPVIWSSPLTQTVTGCSPLAITDPSWAL